MENTNGIKGKISALRTSQEDRDKNYTGKSYCKLIVEKKDGIGHAEIEFFAGDDFPTCDIFGVLEEESWVLSLRQLEKGVDYGKKTDKLVYTNFSIEKCRDWAEEKSAQVRELLKEFENLNKFTTNETMDCVEVYGV